MFYNTAQQKIKKIFINEKLNLSNSVQEAIIKLLSKFCRYEEEGIKIRPNLIIGININYFIQQIPSKYVYELKNEKTPFEFEKKLKSLLPLSNKDYIIFIDFTDGLEKIGFIKFKDNLTVNFDKIIFSKYPDSDIQNKALLLLQYESNSSFFIKGIRGTNETISYDFVAEKKDNKNLTSFLCNLYKNKNIECFLSEYCKLLKRNVHGCICIFCNSKILKHKILKSGIWLESPIKFIEKAIQFKESNDDYNYYLDLKNEVNLSFDLINNDGITIFDEKANIIAYNVFVTSKEDSHIPGGARRRAAEYIDEHFSKKIIGLYFQSQDGETFFKEYKNE